MKLINLEYALQQLEMGEFEHRGVFETDSSRIKDFLNALPTVDAVEVVHGRWVHEEELIRGLSDHQYVCSVCTHIYWNARISNFKYCPNCGAKMDGDWNEK